MARLMRMGVAEGKGTMRKADVVLGEVYWARVSGRVVPVKVCEAHHQGGWYGLNTETGREVRIRTAGRLRSRVVEHARPVRVDAPGEKGGVVA